MKSKDKVLLLVFLLSLGMTGAIIILWVLAGSVLRDSLIINLGIRTFGALCRNLSLTAIGGGVCALAAGVPLVKRKLSQRRSLLAAREHELLESKVAKEYAKNNGNPELTRKHLNQIRDSTPQIAETIDRCLRQMDRMDDLQMKQNVLISNNSATYLEYTVATFDNIERKICQNLRVMINIYIAADNPESVDSAKVEKTLTANDTLLANARKLLDLLVDRINKYNADNSYSIDEREVKAMIDTITGILEEE